MGWLGDILTEIEFLIDWDVFNPLIERLYNNKSEKGGCPNLDEIIMIKLLVMKEFHGLSNPDIERVVPINFFS